MRDITDVQDRYVSFYELVGAICKLYPERYNKARCDVLKEVMLAIHGLRVFETDERNRLREAFCPMYEVKTPKMPTGETRG